MGTVFSLYKRTPKQCYDLGKARRGYAPGHAPSEHFLNEQFSKLYKAASPSIQQLIDRYGEARAITDPGWDAMWSIMGDRNYVVFKLSRLSRDKLADRLFRGSQNIDDMRTALKVADHMLAWAGDDDVTLNAEEPEELARLGWPTSGYEEIGGIWDVMD